VRVTVPRGGSQSFALQFAQKHAAWVETQLRKHPPVMHQPQPWSHGTQLLFRGEKVTLSVQTGQPAVSFAEQTFRLRQLPSDLRPYVEAYLRHLATVEFPGRVDELARQLGISIARTVVRNQRSRWGSCSAKSTISLNWRLIQAPPFVRDYIIMHELMHTREMNHSARFWKLVEINCPEFKVAEKWLDTHDYLMRGRLSQ
jgi:predicted metal-dependent hydrolase